MVSEFSFVCIWVIFFNVTETSTNGLYSCQYILSSRCLLYVLCQDVLYSVFLHSLSLKCKLTLLLLYLFIYILLQLSVLYLSILFVYPLLLIKRSHSSSLTQYFSLSLSLSLSHAHTLFAHKCIHTHSPTVFLLCLSSSIVCRLLWMYSSFYLYSFI